MTDERQLNFDELNAGDVLVMMGPQDVSWPEIIAKEDLDAALIQAIMWLTNSDVCHGAIYSGLVSATHTLIDDGEKGVAQHSITQGDGKPDHWYVRRLTGQSNLQPVLDQAKAYTAEGVKTAYDWELLTMLGLLLVYRKVTPNTPFFQALLVLLERVVVTLDQLMHDKSVDYFVCSQFVAACFDQAGDAYALTVEGGNLQPQGQVSVIDHCVQQAAAGHLPESDSEPLAITPLSSRDLKLWLEGQSNQQNQQLGQSLDPKQTLGVCDRFLKWFFKINGSVLGLSADQWSTPEKRFSLAKTLQADFVTPADLKSHCTNLEVVGKISFVYGKPIE